LEALDHAWHAYSKRVFGFLHRMCWSPSEAASLTEEVFAVLWRGAMLVAEETPLDLTLYRLARNVYVVHERELVAAAKAKQSSAASVGGPGTSSRLRPVVPTNSNMSGRKARKASKSEAEARDAALGTALLAIETDAHMVFVLLVYQGLTPSQVGVVMGISREEVMDMACHAEARARMELAPLLSAGVTSKP